MSNEYREAATKVAHVVGGVLRTSLLSAALLGATGADAAAAQPELDVVEPLTLHYGDNVVPAFLPDGRPATILMAHRENGNAHAYNVYVVHALAASRKDAQPGMAELIDVQSQAGAWSDLIRDEPFDGEAEIGALRFVRERVAGRPSIALVQARRRVADVPHLTDPTPVELTIWRLDGPADEVGRTAYVFRVVRHRVTDRRYCNATSALHEELDIAYPDGWDAPPTEDGCIDAASAARHASGLRMLQVLDATSFDNSTGPRRRPGLRTFADYGFTQTESFDDGWAYASQPDRSWAIGMLVLEDGDDRKLLCVTDASRGEGTYHTTTVVEAVPDRDGRWRATGRVVARPDCAATGPADQRVRAAGTAASGT